MISTGAAVLPGAMPTATMRPAVANHLERLRERLRQPEDFERDVDASAIGQFADSSRCICRGRVDQIRRAETTCRLELVVLHIDRDDLRRAEGMGDLNDVDADAADGDHSHALAAAQFGAVSHRAVSREHRASEDGRFFERQPIDERKDVGRRNDGVLGKSRHRVHRDRRPSRRLNRVVPSYSVPFKRFIAKKLSHRSSRPAPHGVQNPHGMMKADTTFDPIAGPFTPAPSAATVPEISCPITAGVGNATSAFITCRSV